MSKVLPHNRADAQYRIDDMRQLSAHKWSAGSDSASGEMMSLCVFVEYTIFYPILCGKFLHFF